MSEGGKWMPGQGRHGKRTPWWVFALHLVMVFAFTLAVVLAWREGVTWLVIVAVMAWLSSFALAATDNVTIPVVERVKTHAVDRLRKMGKTRKTEESTDPEPSGEGE